MNNTRLSLKPILVILVLAGIWGAGWAVIKIGGRDFAPLFMAGMRSLIAGVCLLVWIKLKGWPLFPTRSSAAHGLVIGLMFALQFTLSYIGVNYTLTSRVYVLVYTAPFAAAVGAHFFLPGDRLNAFKLIGLVLAFSGTFSLFVKDLGSFTLAALPGDLLVLAAGMTWGSSTVYVKKYLMTQARPMQVLFYNMLFSFPVLLTASLIFEAPMIKAWSWTGAFSIFYQSVIIAFLSYLTWMELISRYPISLVHAFSFFTPVCGVFLSGVIIMGESLTVNLLLGLGLVSLGLILVNRA